VTPNINDALETSNNIRSLLSLILTNNRKNYDTYVEAVTVGCHPILKVWGPSRMFLLSKARSRARARTHTHKDAHARIENIML